MAVRFWVLVGGALGLGACEFHTASGGPGDGGVANTDDAGDPDGDDGVDDGDGASASNDVSGGATQGDGPVDSTASPDDGSDAPPVDDDGGVPMTEHLQHVDLSQCGEPLWCFELGLWDPVGVPSSSVECYVSTLTGPIAVTSFQFFIPGYDPNAAPFMLQVWNHAGGPSGEPFFQAELDPGDYTAGPNVWTAPEPVPVPNEFCIGLTIVADGLDARLGFGVEQSQAEQAGLSFARLFGPAGCNYPNWSDVAAFDFTPPGNWCFAVDVVSPP